MSDRPGPNTTIWGVVIAAALIGFVYWWLSGIPGLFNGYPGRCMPGGCYKIGLIVEGI